MTTKALIKSVLEKWGFPVVNENECSIAFRYQMSYVQANVSDNDDSNAVALTLSGVFTADNEIETLMGLRTCNALNFELMQVKLYLDSDDELIIASEFFFKTEDDMEHLLKMALQSLIIGKVRFTRKYPEIEEEAKLLSELEQE